MAKSVSVTVSTEKQRISTAAGRFGLRKDKWGVHFYRILVNDENEGGTQRVDFTITPAGVADDGTEREGGLIIRKYNFVPRKFQMAGTIAYQSRWIGILKYEHSPESYKDHELCMAHGGKMFGSGNGGSSVGAQEC